MPSSNTSLGGFSRNIFANAMGRIWSIVANLLFVPVYLAHLGGEAYGLVVFYLTLFATIAALDAGLGSVLTRQVSIRRFSNETGAARDFRILDLARTVEIILIGIAALIATVILTIAPWIVNHWLNISSLSRSDATTSVRLMGVIVAVQWPAIAYQGALVGLERQVKLNVIRTGYAAVQSFCAAAVVAFASGGVIEFFLIVLVSQFCCTLTLRWAMWRDLRHGSRTLGRFAMPAVMAEWRFGLGMASIGILTALLTQTDKLIMSRAPLAEFSVYGIAATVCGLLGMLGYPIFSAVLPKLTRAVSNGENQLLERTYLLSCEVIAAFAVPAWAMLTFFPSELMSLWIGAGVTASKVSHILPIYGTGSLVNVLVTMPYALQVASGWTSLSIKKNILAALCSVPLLLVVIPKWGAVGAAAVWVAINLGYLVFEVPIVHMRLFGSVKPYWWIRIVFLPMALASGSALLLKATFGVPHQALMKIMVLVGEGLALMAIVSMSLSTIRSGIYKVLTR